MSNESFGDIRANQPAFTLTGNDLFPVENQGNTRISTIDELSALITGNTVVGNITDTYRLVTVTPVGLTNNRISISSGLVSWGSAESDPYGAWSGATPTRITIPAGYTKARLTVNLILDSGAVSNITRIAILKNGGLVNPVAEKVVSSGMGSCQLISRVIPVSAGDYFEIDTNVSSAITGNSNSYFQLELLEMIAP